MLNTSIKTIWVVPVLRWLLIDLLALGFILFMPALSHLTGLPVYFIEPMRIMLIVGLVLSSRYNAYALAIMLPLFSFLVSGHPAPLKMFIIMAELLVNVWLFVQLGRYTKKPFISMFTAIFLSKVFCYLLYWMVFSWNFVIEEAGIGFLIAQAVLTVFLSAVVALVSKKKDITALT